MNIKQIYEKNYKALMLIPIFILLFSAGVLIHTKLTTGEFIQKDISLKGGLLITIQTLESLDTDKIQAEIQSQIQTSLRVKQLNNIGGGIIGYTIESDTQDSAQLKAAITKATNFEFAEGTYTIEEMSSALSEAFFQSAIKASLIAFLLMSIVVFIYFKEIIPSAAVILAAVTDILGALAFMNLLGIKLSTAGVAAILMLIGYSVDTDILLTTRVLKRTEDSLINRVYSSIGTGIAMQLTTLAAMVAIFIISPALVLKQIALIIIAGVLIDIPTTWLGNAGMLILYVKSKHGKD